MSELPKSAHLYPDERPAWKDDPEVRRDRHLLVPDTVEWSGRRPAGDQRRYEPIELRRPDGFPLRLPCRDKPKGRLITTSTCTGLATPTMPFGDHAWDYLGIAEAAAEAFLVRPMISRVDFARDVRVPDSVRYLREQVKRAAASDLEVDTYRRARRLGITYGGVAGGDCLRIYHKGLETQTKLGLSQVPEKLADVVRVELQVRKGQLDDRLRGSVEALRTARVEPERKESDVPVMRLKPSPGHGVRRTHLWAMRRNRHPRRALEATEAVDRFLIEQGMDGLLPGAFGVVFVDPWYGFTPPR